MKRWRILLALALVCVCMAGSLVCEAAKKTIAVTGVENSISNSYGRKAAQELDAALTTILVQCGSYNVVERQQLDHVMKELALGTTGLISGDTAIRFGQMTGSDYTVVGNVVAADVSRFDNYLYKGTKAKIKFNFKFIDNKTGVIKIAELIEGSDTVNEFENKRPDKDIMLSSAAKDVAKKTADKIGEIVAVDGLVIKVSGDAVYIDLGSNNGMRSGDKLLVVKEGEALIHPVTGEIIGVEETVVGQIQLKEVKSNYSMGEIKKGAGQITVGCKVRRGK